MIFIKYLAILGFLNFINCNDKKKKRNFRVSPEITTSWTFCRNQALFASEFLYQQDQESFWTFFKELNNKKNIKQAGKCSKSDLQFTNMTPLMKLNLEMDFYAPKFEAMAQAQLKIITKCPDSTSFIEYQDGKFACSLKEIKGKEVYGIRSTTSFDYLKLSDSQKPFVRIYTLPGSKEFNEIFDKLKGYNLAVQLIVKPLKCPFYTEEVVPTGYGLEFELKSSQYVVEEPQDELTDDEAEAESYSGPVLKAFSEIEQVTKIQGKALSALLKQIRADVNFSFKDILKVSTNLPLISDDLSLNNVDSSISDAQPSRFRINGLELISTNVDPFRLLEFMNIYHKIVNEMSKFSIDKSDLKRLLRSRGSRESKSSLRYNIQSESITFLNDLEKDLRYSTWPKSFESLEEEGKFLGKNILTVVVPINFEGESSVSILENLIQMVSLGYPVRLSVIPIYHRNDNLAAWIKSFFAIRKVYGLRSSISFLRNAIKLYKNSNDSQNSRRVLSVLLSQMNLKINEEDGEEMLKEVERVCDSFSISKENDEIFMNGLPMPITPNFSELLMNQYGQELKFIIENDLDNTSDDIYKGIMKKYQAKTSRMSFKDISQYKKDYPIESIKTLTSLKHYIETEDPKVTLWLATEYDKPETFNFLLNTIRFMQTSPGLRLRIFVKNPMNSMPNRIILAATAILSESPESIEGVMKFLENFNENYFGQIKKQDQTDNILDEISKKLIKYSGDPDQLTMKEIIKENQDFFSIFNEIDYDETILLSIDSKSFKIPLKESTKISNNLDELIISDDRYFKLAQGRDHVVDYVLIYSIFEGKLLDYLTTNLSHLITLSTEIPPFPDTSNCIEIGNDDESIFHVEAIYNPFNREGQRFSSIMSYFATSSNELLSFKLILTANLKSNDPKDSRVYRYVTPESKGIPIPIVFVTDEEILLALSLDLPPAWMTISTFANADLDNIRPIKVSHLKASFHLKRITIEGQVISESSEIASGKIVQLYNSESGLFQDETLIMANYGYYQLKASPGRWNFRVINSDFEEEYTILEGNSRELISFGGSFNQIKISNDPIKIVERIIKKKQADLNVFSLASGLFYERLLRIMILSVIKSSKNPNGTSVKFWLLESTLSPECQLTLEILSKELKFEYELLAYKWPSWLNPQIKKHRTIWAYKILFLDVLFPLDLEKIVFIDADQVVRSDLMELVNLDLKGNVYAMTPFCSDKEEMAPFRFWEQGYWKNHLRGLPYHISALFVVDLVQLRKRFVADIIRSQYHLLSQDPNSLSNLDQDLPNNLQSHIPIYSLPQEWLWCDTWCSPNTKSSAKTIDLCNNPKTFESKIDQALRIIPEWKSFDEEITEIIQKGKNKLISIINDNNNERDEL